MLSSNVTSFLDFEVFRFFFFFFIISRFLFHVKSKIQISNVSRSTIQVTYWNGSVQFFFRMFSTNNMCMGMAHWLTSEERKKNETNSSRNHVTIPTRNHAQYINTHFQIYAIFLLLLFFIHELNGSFTSQQKINA